MEIRLNVQAVFGHGRIAYASIVVPQDSDLQTP